METGIHELTAAYALDALDAEERLEYETHLRDCAACQDELASLASVTEALAVAASGPAPRPELRDRVLEAARAEPQTVVPFESRRRRALPVAAAVAAVAAAVALASRPLGDAALGRPRRGAHSARASAAGGRGPRRPGCPDDRARDRRRPPRRRPGRPSGSRARATFGPAPTGKTYEVWVVVGETPQPAGLFAGQGHADLVDGTVDPGDVVAVTIEDEGGAETPTLPLVVASEPV